MFGTDTDILETEGDVDKLEVLHSYFSDDHSTIEVKPPNQQSIAVAPRIEEYSNEFPMFNEEVKSFDTPPCNYSAAPENYELYKLLQTFSNSPISVTNPSATQNCSYTSFTSLSNGEEKVRFAVNPIIYKGVDQNCDLEFCFDSQLSPAPGPKQIFTDELNNNRSVKSNLGNNRHILPIGTSFPAPTSPVLSPDASTLNNSKGKPLRLLLPKPPLSNIQGISVSMPFRKAAIPVKTTSSKSKTSKSTPRVGKMNTTNREKQSVFKTDMRKFYSSCTREVRPAIQYGQNVIPLAKYRNNSEEFWNVELYEDGTEDLFIERPKRIRGHHTSRISKDRNKSKAREVNKTNLAKKMRTTNVTSGNRACDKVKVSYVMSGVPQTQLVETVIEIESKESMKKAPEKTNECGKCLVLSGKLLTQQSSMLDEVPSLCEDCGANIQDKQVKANAVRCREARKCDVAEDIHLKMKGNGFELDKEAMDIFDVNDNPFQLEEKIVHTLAVEGDKILKFEFDSEDRKVANQNKVKKRSM